LLNFKALPAKDKIYYQDSACVVYCADNREILPLFPDKSFDLVLTDPPYPDQHLEYGVADIHFLENINCPQLVFWSPRADFPLSFTSIHIWDKKTGSACQYERLYERNGQGIYKMFRAYLINSIVAAQMTGDDYTGHPSQKPQKLIKRLVEEYSDISTLILDPFLGSGTTAVAAKILGRKCVGIEISEKYCEIAAKRLSQSVMQLEIPKEDVKTEALL